MKFKEFLKEDVDQDRLVTNAKVSLLQLAKQMGLRSIKVVIPANSHAFDISGSSSDKKKFIAELGSLGLSKNDLDRLSRGKNIDFWDDEFFYTGDLPSMLRKNSGYT